jgi:hypothetical protein
MTSETDHPRQRTVAELLAEHGDTAATGRRRRRRESDAPDEGGAPPEPLLRIGAPADASPGRAAPPAVPDRAVLREPVPPTWPAGAEAPPAGPGGRRRRPDGPPPGALPVGDPPTEVMPQVRGDRRVPDGGVTGPIALRSAPPAPGGRTGDVRPDLDAGPSTMVGAPPPGAESWHRNRTAGHPDSGPPTELAPAELGPDGIDDHPAGLAAEDLDAFEDHDGADHDDPAEPEGSDEGDEPRRRLSRFAGPNGQAWAAVLAQWIAGAVAGAAMWVGFRFLWRELPVVAVAAAVLVVVGLVVVVRALLRNNDLRTTISAVLVGLLLTVSPAVLVLIGR